MYALSASAEGDCYRCVPPDPGIAAAALGASESCTLPGTVPTEALHTFTLDSGASHCFIRDSTTLTSLHAPVPVRLADPSGGPVVARSSPVLPCPVVPSGSLSGLHLPSFSTIMVSTAALQDAMVTTTTPGGQCVSICTCIRTGRHMATFTHRPGSSLYTLATEPPQVAASAHVSASGQVAASCSCRLLSHQTLLWHHHLGHPSLPRLRGMHSRLLVSSLPRSLPPLPPSLAPPCLPCVEGRQRAAPHSSSFPPTTAPLLTLHMDVWGPARVSGQGRKRKFLLVVDDYTRYTMVFPLRSKGEVVDVLIPWICTVRLQLRERFREDLPVLRLHSDRGGEFSSDLLRDFCRGEGILQSFMLPDSPQQNGIAERRIGLVMEVTRTSMIHAAAPHFLRSFAVRYTAHQLNLWPRISLPETSPTLRWTGEVGDASVFKVWGSRAFDRDTSAGKLSARAIPCVFLGFVPDAPGWQFYHPTSRRVFRSQDVTGADLQDGGVHQFTPACQRVTHCTEASTGRHLATFTRQPGSSLYTLTTPSPPVAESGRVAASGQVFAAASRSGPESAPCSCRLLSHETLLWHHRLGHPSLLRLRGMASRFLVSGLPQSLHPLPQGPSPTCVPCVEGCQRAAPHSSQFPPTEAPLQTLHMDVWGPARVRGQGHERYFLLVVDDYSRYTAVFPLHSKGDVTEVLIDWIRAARLQLRQSFGSDFPVLRLHLDRGGEFSSGLLGAFCRARGIRQTFTLPHSPQKNGIAERRIGMVMDVAVKKQE
ncbi:unnamed protein product [Closterium sp. NIES-53]